MCAPHLEPTPFLVDGELAPGGSCVRLLRRRLRAWSVATACEGTAFAEPGACEGTAVALAPPIAFTAVLNFILRCASLPTHGSTHPSAGAPWGVGHHTVELR